MSIADYFHKAATGPKSRRALLTPVGLLVFGSSLFVVIAVFGVLLCGWCVVRFWRAHGTPVPMNPPDVLITGGPYAWVRNPMVTGVFGALFGLGFILHSTGMAVIWTPAYVLMHWIELRRVEEPELARRFGASYLEYKERVPMFIPSLTRILGR